jgi:hypothetical protein
VSRLHRYTTQLQAGLGLIPETTRLLGVWQPGMVGQDLLNTALASGQFPISARRLRNIIIEAFAPRYLIDESRPARLLKALVGHISASELRQILFLYTCRANQVLGDFVREVYWPRYTAGDVAVSKEDSITFVRRAVADGKTTTKWSESTIVRVSRYLLGACADFDLLGPMRAGQRSISAFRISPTAASVLAHDLHFMGLGDNTLVRSPDWNLFGLPEPEDVLAELKRLALRGEVIVQSAGAVTHIAWKATSIEEHAHVLAQG